MGAILLILRPQPGADATAARARTMGREAVVAPMFAVRAVTWEAPDPAEVDAVMLTSANAPRLAGGQVQPFTRLPCFAVGEATAEAAKQAGFSEVHAGPSDGAALLALLAERGMRRALHLCGRDVLPLDHPGVEVARRIVYASDGAERLPEQAIDALTQGAIALLHSPRAGAMFAQLVENAELDRASIVIAAISPAAAAAAGTGWLASMSATEPRDEALLELASKLCNSASREMRNGG
jgi:uroporphyrinogen-III synthase